MKFLSLYGNRAGQCFPMQSPTESQIKIFKAIRLSDEQHAEYIAASKEKREELLGKYRLENPQITGEKKKIAEVSVADVKVVETEKENDPIQETLETMQAIESLEDKIEDVAEKLESIDAKIPVVKTRKPRKK